MHRTMSSPVILYKKITIKFSNKSNQVYGFFIFNLVSSKLVFKGAEYTANICG